MFIILSSRVLRRHINSRQNFISRPSSEKWNDDKAIFIIWLAWGIWTIIQSWTEHFMHLLFPINPSKFIHLTFIPGIWSWTGKWTPDISFLRPFVLFLDISFVIQWKIGCSGNKWQCEISSLPPVWPNQFCVHFVWMVLADTYDANLLRLLFIYFIYHPQTVREPPTNSPRTPHQ